MMIMIIIFINACSVVVLVGIGFILARAPNNHTENEEVNSQCVML